ncbi:regulator of G-protein signaling 7 [Ceratitis capitata]|uniref:regulator of G-protein signaling 7 n=1 Tax=Ceratitis capitata TaxID=7213 RepID=UPI000A106694|nr:regulator of G-protein signaling 7 [Ceratitis capitata]
MVTMTSEMDKTQTSIVMAVKTVAAVDNAAFATTTTTASSPIQTEVGEELPHSQRIAQAAGNGGVAGDTCNEMQTKVATTTHTTDSVSATMKPLELSNVTISIELASEDESSTAATPASGKDVSVSTPVIPTTPSTPQGATPKTTTTPSAAAAPTAHDHPPNTPITTAETAIISTTTPIATAVEATSATLSKTTQANTDANVTSAIIESPPATVNSGSRAINDRVVDSSKVNSNNVATPVTAKTIANVTKDTKAIASITSSASTASSSSTSSTTKVNFCINTNANNSTNNTNTTNSTCTSSTNSTSSVTSMSTPAAAGGSATSNGAGGGAGLGLNSSHYHHQQQQQSSQHGKSSASCSGSGGAGGAGGSHTVLPAGKPSHATGTIVNHPQQRRNEDAPNILVYKKMEAIIEKMQAESTGVAVRTVKAFMSKVPSVFTGADLVAWILKNFDVEDVTEALHFAHLLASHGYIFPIDDHQLTVKNDGTFYRFQTPYFWPSNCWEPENTDYAVYLCKRTMQNKTRLELADYEAENLAKLQKMFSRKWEFIFMQAESQSKVAKKRDKLERKVLDSQERAFWDVHRPMPGCVNTTEIDIKKAYRRGGHGSGTSGGAVAKNPVEQVTRVIALRKQKLERRTIKVSKAAEALVAYYEQYNEFDYFITSPELSNPWQTDSTEMWDAERNSKEVPLRHVKRWGFSLRELLNDPVGREQFAKFLEKEYSGENLKFWESVQQMKTLPQSEIKEAIQKIWQEFLAPDAPCPVNVDSKSVELAREAVSAVNGPNRWCFDVAAAHVYHLMKSDSYSRYLRSDMYKDYLNCSRKKIKSIPNLFGVKR